jgi:hypothetical protein
MAKSVRSPARRGLFTLPGYRFRAIAADHFRRLERTRIDRAEEIALDLALMKEAAQRVKHEPDKLELARKAVENPGDSDAVGI